MSARVKEEDVRRALVWARNYAEIDSFEVLDRPGRRWLVRLSSPEPITISGNELGWLEHQAVPREMVFTGREALTFTYGLAVAGTRYGGRQAHAAKEWGW